jgi:hypothetical protein
MPGITLASSISGSLDAKNIVLGVLTRQLELSNLADLAVSVPVPNLTGTVPIYIPGEADEDLGEWETSEINGGAFSNVDFDLKKDRVKIGVSTEAKYKSKEGDPLAIQQNSAAMVLASALDKKIAKALEVNPQTNSAGDSWAEATHNPIVDLANAKAAILPWPADYVIMHSNVWAAFAGNAYTMKYVTGAPEAHKGVLTTIPGLDLKVYVSDHLTAKTCIVGCSMAPSVALGQGPVEVAEEKVGTSGRIWTMDVFRQAKAPIIPNDNGKNVAAYQLTGCLD